MAVRNIFTDDASCLYKKARPVEKFDKKLHDLLDDMSETMYAAEGVGLAAPQVGILRRIFVMDCGDGLIEAVNPEIIETSGEQGGMEGCLSFPERRGYVVRPNRVVFRAYNRLGELMEYECEGLSARCVMHETDHLDGHVYLEKVTEPPEGFTEEQAEDEREPEAGAKAEAAPEARAKGEAQE